MRKFSCGDGDLLMVIERFWGYNTYCTVYCVNWLLKQCTQLDDVVRTDTDATISSIHFSLKTASHSFLSDFALRKKPALNAKVKVTEEFYELSTCKWYLLLLQSLQLKTASYSISDFCFGVSIRRPQSQGAFRRRIASYDRGATWAFV
jgi:hypothetical protein